MMTKRARAYLLIAAGRAVATAFVLLLMGDEDVSRLYPYILDPLPWWLWISVWAAVGGLLISAACSRSMRLATAGLITIVTVTAVWATGVTLTFIENPAVGTVSGVLWWTLVAKDLIQIRQPLSSPFEDLVKKYGTD